MVLWILVALIGAGMLYVRMAPTQAADWHQPVVAETDRDMAGGAVRVLTVVPGALALADQAMMDEPRTRRLAGSVAEGRITYISRSRIMGYPDYTTLEQDGTTLRMFARLRFGRSDLGVNRARLERIVARVQAGG